MASLSGTINSSTVGGGYKLEIDWSATQSTSANTSTITMDVYWVSLGSSYTISSSASKTGSTSITASTGSGTGSDSWTVTGASLSGNQKRLLHTYTHTVTHDTNGNWSGTLASTFNCAVDLGGMVNSVTASGSVTLTQIPRKSVISGSYDFTAGSNLTVNITRYSSSFTHTVTLWTLNTDGTTWNQIGSALTGKTTSATFDMSSSPPNANATDVFTSLAGRSSCSVWVRIETFSGSTSLGYNDYKSGTCTSPAASTGVIGNPTGISETAGQESSTVYIDQSITLNLTTHLTGVTHTVNFKDGNTGNIIHQATNVTTTVSWTPSTTVNSYYSASYTERNALYKATPNDIELDGQIDIYTYYGGKIVMAATNVDINYRVRNSNPTFTGTGITYKDNNTAVAGVTGNNQYIVQNASDLLVSLPTTANATAQNYATMSYYTASLGGVTKQTNYSSSATITFDLGLINLTANDNVIVTAFDSRGNSTPFNLPVNIVAWKPPSITSTSKRADGFSAPTNITLSGSYSKVTIGATGDKNSIIYAKYQYKKTTDSTYPVSPNAGCLTAFPGFTSGSGTFSTSPTLSVTLDSTLAWNTEVQVLDAIQQALAQTAAVKDNTVAVGTPLVFFDTALSSVGIGKFPEVAGRLEVQGAVNSYDSVGVVNPNTPFATGATLGLSFLSDQARIRYGGNGAGSANGLQIQGSGDAVKWSVSDTGDVNTYGVLYMLNGKNVILKAISGGNDPGDILFENGDGTEKIRIYTGASSNELYFRQSGSRSILSFDLNGDASFGASADPSVVNIPNGSLYIANSTGSTVLRLVTDSTSVYLQGGKDLNDATAKMVFARTGTTSAYINQVYMYATSLFLPGQYTATTASAANLYVGTDGHVYRSSSSRDYKTDIEDLWESQAEKILDLRPVMFKPNSETSMDRPDWTFVGLIAEEVAEIEPRLVHYKYAYDKEKNPDDRTPTDVLKPEGIQYDRIGVYLIPIVKQLRDEVAELKKRLTY